MILIVDDDAVVRSSLSLLLKRAGYTVAVTESPSQVLERVRVETPDLILMDMNFSLTTSGTEGLELLQKVKIFCPLTPVILITAWGSISLAVKGMKAGAFDFITKPWNNTQLLKSIQTALSLEQKRKSGLGTNSRKDLDAQYHFSNIIGESKPLVEVLSTVARIADTNASVLISGESGTGKELIAEAIHLNSKRSKEAFVKVNLGGLSPTLFESEMFGHKKGAYTDAISDRIGRFELANHGSIFLDEIGELDLACQVKLLRVLQDQSFEALGDSRPRKVDVRVISASNADLRQMVEQKSFREDLFYRINLIHIVLPPLRDRSEDIPLLADFFAQRLAKNQGLAPIHFCRDAIEKLQSLSLPGNIRELKNLVERSILVSGKTKINADDLRCEETSSPSVGTDVGEMSLESLEANRIKQSLQRHNGNISHAAKELGISRAALYRRIDKYQL